MLIKQSIIKTRTNPKTSNFTRLRKGFLTTSMFPVQNRAAEQGRVSGVLLGNLGGLY